MNREQWWIDYMEGELDDGTNVQMDQLLRSSKVDFDLVSSLNALKRLMKHHDEVLDLEPARRERIYDQVMAVVENDGKPSQRSRQQKTKPQLQLLNLL